MTAKEIEIQYALGTLTDKMKYKLAVNERTSKEVLTILSTDKDMYVRSCIATNPNTPKEVLKVLSTDKNSDIRWWVAHNSNTPKEVLTKLSKDEDEYVRSYATKR